MSCLCSTGLNFLEEDRGDGWQARHRGTHHCTDAFNFRQIYRSGIFRDKRGHFHILGHWFKNGKGGHAFSRDGLAWTFAGDAYDGELKWDDGILP